MPDARDILNKEPPYCSTRGQAAQYLSATFPKSANGIRVMQGKPGTNEAPFSVGVYGAFGCGNSWDEAIAHLMTDEMIHAYVED